LINRSLIGRTLSALHAGLFRPNIAAALRKILPYLAVARNVEAT